MAATFPTVARGSLAWVARLFLPPFSGRGVPVRRLTIYQTYLTALFSFQRAIQRLLKRPQPRTLKSFPLRQL